jgi:hypothetical protein
MLQHSHLLVAALSLVVSTDIVRADEPERFRGFRNAVGMSGCLDIRNDGVNNNVPVLAKCENVSGQNWRVKDRGDGYVKLTTEWGGRGICLDIRNDGKGNNRPVLAACANAAGQNWKLTPDGSGMRMTTEWRGDQMCLDLLRTKQSTETILTPCRDRAEQRWYLEVH